MAVPRVQDRHAFTGCELWLKTHTGTLTPTAKLLRRRHDYGLRHLRQHRAARLVRRRVELDDLSRLRRDHAHAAGERIDALRIAQRRFFETQRPVHFLQPVTLALLRLYLVAVLNGAVVLPHV